jgi:hypothetical protein
MILTATPLQSREIIVTDDFDYIMKETDTLDSNSLLLFDVDGTLIVPDDAILKHPEAKDIFNLLTAGHTTRDLFREIRLKAPHSLVDSRSISLIQRLQAKNVPVMAFTAAPAKINEQPPGDWRVEELRNYGFDFTSAFSWCSCLEIPKNARQQHAPLFKSGVLFSSFHPKGDILLIFLQLMGLSFKKVIFVDDEFEHVQSVVTCLAKHGITCIGIHYTAAHKTLVDVNIDQARFQVGYFIEHGIWLSDNDCKIMLHRLQRVE